MIARTETQSRYILELDLILPPTELPDEDGWTMEQAWNVFLLHLRNSNGSKKTAQAAGN